MSRTPPRQVEEKFQAGIITPVQILDDEQQGLLCSLVQEEVSQGCKEAAFLLFRVERRQGGGRSDLGACVRHQEAREPTRERRF
jgi:hypothetical protein